MAITADQVRSFREKTGLPMMDCKKALTECGGDEEKAMDWLRKQGLGRVEKMASRDASEGRVACFVDSTNGRGGIVELRCETAPVANTDDFIRLTRLIAQSAAGAERPDPATIRDVKLADDPSRTVGDALNDAFNRLRENMQIARVDKLTGSIGQYIHHNGQVGVLVEMSGPCPDDVKTDVCMHIAAARPRCVQREEVDAAEVAKERAIYVEEAKGKPEAVVGKIVDGKLNRWYSEFVLLEQPFVKDDKKSVGEMLKGVSAGLTVNRFLRYQVGGA